MRQTRKRHYPNEPGQDGLQSVEMQITEEAMASLRERVEAMGAKEEAEALLSLLDGHPREQAHLRTESGRRG